MGSFSLFKLQLINHRILLDIVFIEIWAIHQVIRIHQHHLRNHHHKHKATKKKNKYRNRKMQKAKKKKKRNGLVVCVKKQEQQEIYVMRKKVILKNVINKYKHTKIVCSAKDSKYNNYKQQFIVNFC